MLNFNRKVQQVYTKPTTIEVSKSKGSRNGFPAYLCHIEFNKRE